MGLELVTGYRGTLHITAPQDADLYRGLFGDGRVNVGNLMDVSVTAPLEVTVLDGVCLLDGREFFVANGDSVAVECAVETGTAYLCICYEKDESSLHETADFQVLESYNDIDIRTGPSASQKPYAKLTVENGTITNVEMLVDTAEPIIDISREAGETLDKVDGALENVDDTLDKMNEYFESLSALTERTEQAAESAESAAERAETVAEDALTGVTVNDVPQEIVDHVVNIIAPDQEEIEEIQAKNTAQDTDISALQTENAELKAQIAEMEEEISELNSDLTKSYTVNGINFNFRKVGRIVQLSISGSAEKSFGTSSSDAGEFLQITPDELGDELTPVQALINRPLFTTSIFGQLNLSAGSNGIRLGLTYNLSGSATPVSAGTTVYCGTTYIAKA